MVKTRTLDLVNFDRVYFTPPPSSSSFLLNWYNAALCWCRACVLVLCCVVLLCCVVVLCCVVLLYAVARRAECISNGYELHGL
jgi:hypothetical protein